jgi:ribosomal protein L17
MPKKENKETAEEQSARFRAEVERLIAAGELNPTEADRAFEQLITRLKSGDQSTRRF